jgi:[ribulose-bisphosphate carboxylase]-lysine N-methyltransferase
VPHKRGGNTVWKVKSSGVFGRSQVLSVESTKALRKGEALSMDYGPDKLDNTLLLDHGVLDTATAKVGGGGGTTIPVVQECVGHVGLEVMA